MPDITIRAELPADHDKIRTLTAAAFEGKTYSDGTEADIPDRLRAAGDLSLSLVALDGETLVGHVAVSPVRVGEMSDGWFCLGPISVRPDRQKQGIGSALIAAALDWLRAQAAAGCVLTGDPGYYSRFGFVSDGALTYGTLDTRFVQRISIHGPDSTGEVQFAPAFGDAD